jgi:hypothetical protein
LRFVYICCLRLRLVTFRFTLLRYIWLVTFCSTLIVGYVRLRLHTFTLVTLLLRLRCLFVVVRFGCCYVTFYVVVCLRSTLRFRLRLRLRYVVYGCVWLRLRWLRSPRYRLFALVTLFVAVYVRLRLLRYVTLRLRCSRLLRCYVCCYVCSLLLLRLVGLLRLVTFVYVCLLRSLLVYRSLRSTFVVGYVRLVRLVGLLVGFVG